MINPETSRDIPASALIDLRNELAAAADKRTTLIQLFVGRAVLSGDDSTRVTFTLGEHRAYMEVVQALDALMAVQSVDEELFDLTELDSDPNIDRLEDL